MGHMKNKKIKTNRNMQKGRWVAACDLKPGDRILTADGRLAVVRKVEIQTLDKPMTTYNFEVEDFHNYFVGNAGVLVHNRCVLGERMKKQGLLDDTQDAHHLYPKKFERQFSEIKINVDDVVNGMPMEATFHRAKAQVYNRLWQNVDDTVHIAKLSPEQTRKLMVKFMFQAYGIKV